MRARQVVIAGCLLVSASGCAWQQDPGLVGSRTVLGAAGGAAAGGLLGATLGGSAPAIAAGTILGLLAGGAVGNTMDGAAKARAQEAAYRAYQTGQRQAWYAQGAAGAVTPTGQVVMREGYPCRKAEVVTRSEGREYVGRVCLRATGRAGEVVVEPLGGRH